jgi:hypothetical protein
MDRPRKRFVMLVVPVALILFGSFLLAQGPPPKPCAKTCQKIYADSVKSCHGDQACLAAARGAVLNCLSGCSQSR